MLKYNLFTSSEEFEGWQREKEAQGVEYVLHQLTPIIGNIELNALNESMSGELKVNLFVIYQIQ